MQATNGGFGGGLGLDWIGRAVMCLDLRLELQYQELEKYGYKSLGDAGRHARTWLRLWLGIGKTPNPNFGSRYCKSELGLEQLSGCL